jgi:hypothetical protein
MLKLSSVRLEKTLRKLPTPLVTYKSSKARFNIYRAKDLYVSSWKNTSLRTMVVFCRMSYARYGNRPLFDVYDGKAAIYLVKIIYGGNKSKHAEEWLSIRMVPGNKKPIGVGEPELFQSEGKPVLYWLKRKFGVKNFWTNFISSSRMCGVHPYSINSQGAISFLRKENHRFTSVAFALIHEQFFKDYPLARFPYRYITAIIRSDFYKKALGYRSRKRMLYPVHTLAHTVLDVDRRSLHVNRSIYSYDFPLYWFDNKKLLGLVNHLREKQNKDPLNNLDASMFTNLSKKTKNVVSVAGIDIEPQKMRSLIDKSVPDAPELRITKAEAWYRSMARILRAAKVTPMS